MQQRLGITQGLSGRERCYPVTDNHQRLPRGTGVLYGMLGRHSRDKEKQEQAVVFMGRGTLGPEGGIRFARAIRNTWDKKQLEGDRNGALICDLILIPQL